MSKYDFKLDLSDNSSTGLILNKIQKNSVVLEFGCATGRMTQYMKNDLDCQVYIVEYDQAAFDQASAFAADGLCDDILNYRWVERFSDVQFDAIIFADVLEHLTAPGEVLRKAAALLKNTGSVYISLPNVTHNDIVIKAIEERFDYTKVGLLDDTHVHFWGLENLEELANGTGLNVRNIEATYCPTGYTEQYGSGILEHRLLRNLLQGRKCGEVYQFVLTLDKQEKQAVNYQFRTSEIRSHVYLDTGKDFNAEECVGFSAQYLSQGTYRAYYKLENAKHVKRIRFDPLEGQGCILTDVSIRQGTQTLDPIFVEGTTLDMMQGVLLRSDDPWIYAETLENDAPLILEATIILLSERYMHIVQDAYVDKSGELLQTKNEKNELTHTCLRLQTENAEWQAQTQALQAVKAALEADKANLQDQLKIEIQAHSDDVCALTEEKADMQKTIDAISSDNQALRTDIGFYIKLVDNKDQYAIRLEQELDGYKSLLVVRVYLMMWCILNWMKRFTKRVLRAVYRRVKPFLKWGVKVARHILRPFVRLAKKCLRKGYRLLKRS